MNQQAPELRPMAKPDQALELGNPQIEINNINNTSKNGQDVSLSDDPTAGNDANPDADVISSSISLDDISDSKLLWIKDAQHQVAKNKNFDILCKQLNCFTDKKGIIRCKGRLENSTLPYDSKYPILNPSAHPITKLIVA